MAKAFYPGSFDPAHNGHIDVATRASKLFDEVIVGVYDAPPKTLMFDTDERVELFEEALELIEEDPDKYFEAKETLLLYLQP